MAVDSLLKQYQTNKTEKLADDLLHATPHRVIQALLEGAIERIIKAKFFLEHTQKPRAAEQISLAISIIGGLEGSLNHEKGGDLSKNLKSLYDYMSVTLLQANVHSDVKKLSEVESLLKNIKEGWDGIPADKHQLTNPQLEN